jgi:hypothetical protein
VVTVLFESSAFARATAPASPILLLCKLRCKTQTRKSTAVLHVSWQRFAAVRPSRESHNALHSNRAIRQRVSWRASSNQLARGEDSVDRHISASGKTALCPKAA